MATTDQILFGLLTVFIASVVGYVLYVARGSTKQKKIQEEVTETATKKKKKQPQQQVQTTSKKSQKSKEKETNKVPTQTHPWQAGTIKGHTAEVSKLDFSLNGKYLASVAQDKTALISLTKEFLISDHKQIRTNLGLDSADNVFWSPDSKAFLISKSSVSALAVYKLGKKPDGNLGNITQLFQLEKAHSDNSIIGISIASNGKFMLSASHSGEIKVWDLKGSVLSQHSAQLEAVNCIKVSSCGRFVGFCGNSSKVQVWSVKYAKAGSYETLTPAYVLEGHDKEVFGLDFNVDATVVVSIDKKGSWRLFDTTGTKPTLRFSGSVTPGNCETMIVAISHDSLVSAVAVENRVELFAGKSGNHLKTVETYYEEPLTDIKFSVDDLFFVTAAAGDRSIKIFHNIGGYSEKIKDLRSKAKSADKGAKLKERLLEEATTVEASLKNLKISA